MKDYFINKKVNPQGLKNDEYDAIIIGAGIGGLTCGCYLAKAGLKVLIVEQHFKAGGYCTSFKRKGYTFDAAAHYIGGFRKNGPLSIIFRELELDSKVKIIRFDPSDIVIFPDYQIYIWNNFNKTISELQESFQNEAINIDKFFKFLLNSEFAKLYVQLKGKTFKELLDLYFNSTQLKSILGIFLGNIGVSPSKASALASALLFREFVVDGGYYPKGGMQVFSDAFVSRFKELGGEILFGEKAKKIIVENDSVKGIAIDNNNLIPAKVVVSNCDATNTFMNLVGKEFLPSKFIRKIDNLEISPSAFMVYLGLNRNYSEILNNRCSLWCSLSNNLNVEETLYSDLNRQHKPYSEDFVFCVIPTSHDPSLAPQNNDVVTLIVPAKITDNNFWQENKYNVADELISKAENIMPGLSKAISVREIATPLTFNRYTSNKNGASYGWAYSLSQIDKETMPAITPLKGLYLSGHWVTQGIGHGGVSTVAYCGKNVAKTIINRVEFKNQ